MKENEIVAYVHCRTCVLERRKPDIEAGLVNATTLRVWCRVHDHKVADFYLAAPMQDLTCSICGGDLTEGDHDH